MGKIHSSGVPLVFVNTIQDELRSLNGFLFRFRRKRRKTTKKQKTMKKAMNKAAECYEKTMGCTIQETVLGIGIMAVGVVCIWMAAVLQGGAA